jgi:putative membrane protein
MSTERTALAWSRTALAMVANGGLLIRVAVDRSGVAAIVAWLLAAGALAAGATAWMFGQRSYTGVRARILAGQSVARPEAVRALAVCTAALAVGVAALIAST